MAPPKTKFTRISVNALSFADLCWHLQNGEYNRDELRELVGISDSTLRTWLTYLRRIGKKQVCICERRQRLVGQGGAAKLYYTWGNEPDAPEIKRKGTAHYSAVYRRRKLLKETMYGIASNTPTGT
jgi:hypothetical protein